MKAGMWDQAQEAWMLSRLRLRLEMQGLLLTAQADQRINPGPIPDTKCTAKRGGRSGKELNEKAACKARICVESKLPIVNLL